MCDFASQNNQREMNETESWLEIVMGVMVWRCVLAVSMPPPLTLKTRHSSV